MKNVIKFAEKNGMDFEVKTGFTGFKRVVIKTDGKTFVVRERNSDRTYTVKGYQGHSEKYCVSIAGERYEHYTNTQKSCVEYIMEELNI